MADDPKIEVGGLQLSNNTFSASPPGSLSRADNCVMPQKGVIEPRKGQDRAYLPPSNTQIPFAQCEFNGSLIINSATDKFDDYTLGIASNPTMDFTGGPWNPVDSSPNAGAPAMKFGFAGSFLHFCTTTGAKTLETTSSNPRTAGLQRMPDIVSPSLSSPGVITPPWLPFGASVAYRTLIRRATASGVSLLGPPSGRAVITNTLVSPVGDMSRTLASVNTVTVTIPGLPVNNVGLNPGDFVTIAPGEANFPAGTYAVTSLIGTTQFTYDDAHAAVNATNTVTETFNPGPRATYIRPFLPDDAVAGDFIRVYRSHYTSVATIEPSDEMFLVAEHQLNSTDISNGYWEFNDTTPDSTLFDPLYTNPQTGEGPTQGNFRPPIYRDLTNWGAREWYAQTTALQSVPIQMLGVGAPDGIQNGDTFDIVTPDAVVTTFTFTNAPAAPTDVWIRSDSIPSVNILNTARNFIQAINTFFGPSGGQPERLRAYYTSSEDESPGKILLENTVFTQSVLTLDGQFGIRASRPATWVPGLDTTNYKTSTEEYKPNGLSYSKLDQPEAVPLVNYTAIGSKNYPIARILGLQNALLVFKKGDGIYSVTGSYPFHVLQISTANIIASDACCVHADNAWAYTDQGFLRITDSGGSTVVSRPIETELNSLRDELPDETALYSFAVPYETSQRLMLFVPFSGNDATAPPTLVLKAYCYNSATQAWTGPLSYKQPFSGVVGLIANKLSLGIYDTDQGIGAVTLERKGNGYLDYADETNQETIFEVNVGGNPLIIKIPDGTLSAGDGIIQGQWATKVKRLRPDIGADCLEVYEDVPFTVGTCNVYGHYDVTLQFLPSGSPSARRVLTRLSFLFKPEWFASFAGNSIVLTDQVQADLEVSTPSLGFGLTPFGSGPFGNPTPMSVDVNPLNALWTTAAQFFVGFELSEVWPKLKLQGYVAAIHDATGPAGRGRG